MTQSQQALETRLAEDPLEGFEPEPSAGDRRSPDPEGWTADHPVDIRLSIPFLFARCYVTIVAGKERRSPNRREAEYKKHSLLKAGNVMFIVAVQIVFCLAILYAGLSMLAT